MIYSSNKNVDYSALNIRKPSDATLVPTLQSPPMLYGPEVYTDRLSLSSYITFVSIQIYLLADAYHQRHACLYEAPQRDALPSLHFIG
jgi:hypothetical protein